MPIIECGFIAVPPPNSPQTFLAQFGPTVLIDIGFDPALIANLAAVTPGAAPSPITTPVVAPNIQNIPALIDTGASHSCIDDTLAQQLGLPLVNQQQSGGVHGLGLLNVYLAYISIPPLGITQAGAFTGANMAAGNQPHRALLGRTLLQDLLLVYDGRSGSVKLAH